MVMVTWSLCAPLQHLAALERVNLVKQVRDDAIADDHRVRENRALEVLRGERQRLKRLRLEMRGVTATKRAPEVEGDGGREGNGGRPLVELETELERHRARGSEEAGVTKGE